MADQRSEALRQLLRDAFKENEYAGGHPLGPDWAERAAAALTEAPAEQSSAEIAHVEIQPEVTPQHRALAVDFLFPRTPKPQRDGWVDGGILDSGHWRRAEFTAIHDLAKLFARRDLAAKMAGAAAERGAIAAWLNVEHEPMPDNWLRNEPAVRKQLAHDIERGEHHNQ